VKHENHLPIGAFKLRGGLTYFDYLTRSGTRSAGVITATRGNHGQSIAFAARRCGLAATIVVPQGNSREKNAAMRALGANLIEHGSDFHDALQFATAQALEMNLTMVPSFDPALVVGVASYALEFFRSVANLDTIYVPIGLGSGICGLIAARQALKISTKIVGVVADQAPAYALSFKAGEPVETDSAATFADGIACRVPDSRAVTIINRYADRVVAVSEDHIADAIRFYFSDTHNVAEGAGAAPLAALIQEREQMAGRKVGLILSGGNIDRDLYARILGGQPLDIA
jgi:threonine dehydratase